MPGSRHEELRKVAREYLKMHYGFKEEELFEEYEVEHEGGKWKVDIAAVDKTRRVAAEVGDISIYKLLAIAEFFTDVVWIPYWINVVTGEENLAAEVNRRVAAGVYEAVKVVGTEQGRQLMDERAKHAVTTELLERVLWTVTTRVQDASVKADIARLIKDHGVFEAKKFSPAQLDRAREKRAKNEMEDTPV